MTDLDDAVAAFLEDAETVFDEYERGYVDADVALSQLEHHVGRLRERVEE